MVLIHGAILIQESLACDVQLELHCIHTVACDVQLELGHTYVVCIWAIVVKIPT